MTQAPAKHPSHAPRLSGRRPARVVAAALVLVSAVLGGCTPYPNKISAANVSTSQYLGLSCRELVSQRNDVARKLNAANSVQLESAQINSFLVGGLNVVLLPYIMAAWLVPNRGGGNSSGGNFEAEISLLKGEYDALTRAGTPKGCFPDG